MTYKLKLNECVHTIPTIGFNVETLNVGKGECDLVSLLWLCRLEHRIHALHRLLKRAGVTMTIWDVGGQEVLRPLWRHYYANSRGGSFSFGNKRKQNTF